ncbi:MAG: Hpt domain-containing protein [Gemmobacter sp.]
MGIGMIDWTRLDELSAEIGREAIAEVVAMFLEEADEVVSRLPRDSTTMARASDLHFLKGAALNLGFTYLAQMCDAGERAPAMADMTAIAECYRQSRDLFQSGLAANTAA